jgi:hypothetical protein
MGVRSLWQQRNAVKMSDKDGKKETLLNLRGLVPEDATTPRAGVVEKISLAESEWRE